MGRSQQKICKRRSKPMSKKIFLFFCVLVLPGTVRFGESQTSQRLIRIGYLGNEQFSSRLDAAGKDLPDELRKWGWIEGQNIVVEQRYWENRIDRLIAQAAE